MSEKRKVLQRGDCYAKNSNVILCFNHKLASTRNIGSKLREKFVQYKTQNVNSIGWNYLTVLLTNI